MAGCGNWSGILQKLIHRNSDFAVKGIVMPRILPEGIMCGFLLGCAAGICVAANAAAPPNRSGHDAPASARVLMVSDMHFDPFWDPGKAAQMAAAPESRWVSILRGPASPDRA